MRNRQRPYRALFSTTPMPACLVRYAGYPSGLCVSALILSFVLSLPARSLCVWSIDRSRSAIGTAGAGAMFVGLDMLRRCALSFVFPFLPDLWLPGDEWRLEIRQLACDCFGGLRGSELR